MIRLSGKTAFAHGNHREVYRHPENKDRCLKFMVEDWKDSPRWKRANFLAKIFRPHSYFHENESEFQFSNQTDRKVGKEAWEFIARAHGYVESDLGKVLEVDLITDANGEISLTLKEYLWRYGMTSPCEAALEVFWKQLHDHGVVVQARPDNLTIKVREDGVCQLYAIDGYTFGPFIPLAKWFRSEQVRRLAKLHRNQVAKIEQILAQRESKDAEALGSQGIRTKD